MIHHHLLSFIMITEPKHCQGQISVSINAKTSLKLRKNRTRLAETCFYTNMSLVFFGNMIKAMDDSNCIDSLK